MRLKMRILTLIILLVREVVGEGSCSKGTDEPVTDCPRDEKLWIKAGERKNCTQFITKDCADLQYHCLINAYGNGTVEVCAKLTYLQGYCAEYNPLTLSIKNHLYLPCLNFTVGGKCPSRYKSTDAYLYPHCYDLVKKASKKSQFLAIQKEASYGTLIAVGTSMIILLLISFFGFFIVYQVKCQHLSCKEALQKIPFCGNHLAERNSADTGNEKSSDGTSPDGLSEAADTGNEKSSDGTSPDGLSEEVAPLPSESGEETPLLGESVEQHPEEEESMNKYPKLGETLQRDIEEVDKKCLVKHDDRMKEEEIGNNIPKLDSLMDRLDAFRTSLEKEKVRLQHIGSLEQHPEEEESMNKYPKLGETLQRCIEEVDIKFLVKHDVRMKEEEIGNMISKVDSWIDRLDAFRTSLEKEKVRLQHIGSFGEKFRAKAIVVFVNKIANFKKKLKQAEHEVKYLAKQVEMEQNEDYLRIDEKGYSERIASLEKKIEKLEGILEKNAQ